MAERVRGSHWFESAVVPTTKPLWLCCGANTFSSISAAKTAKETGTRPFWFSVAPLTARHFYSAYPTLAADTIERGLDLLCPVYNILDLTSKERGIGMRRSIILQA